MPIASVGVGVWSIFKLSYGKVGGNSKRKESLYTLIVNAEAEEMMRIKAMNANGEYQYQEVNAALRR